MRLRDALKSEEQCEAEEIGEDTQIEDGNAWVRDGGTDTDIWPYVRETRRRLIRVEGRQVISLKLQIGTLITVLGGIVAGVVLAVL